MKNLIFFTIVLSLLITLSSISIAGSASVRKIDADGEPVALAIDEEGGRLFSLNYLKNTLSVIDENQLKVVKTIALGKRINRNVGGSALIYDASLNEIFISTGGGEVLIFDGRSFELKGEIRIDRFIPDIASDGYYLYLLDWSGNIHRYRGSREDWLVNFAESGSPYMHLAKNKRIYLSSGSRGLLVIDSEKGEVLKKIEINVLSAVASSSKHVFVAGPGKLYVIGAERVEVEKVISLDYGNYGGLGILYNRKNGYTYVVTEGNRVSIVDPQGSGRVVKKIDVCERPGSLAVNSKTGVVYVACPSAKAINVLKE